MAIVTILLGLSLVGIVWLWFHLKRNHGRLDPALPKLPTILCFGSPPFLYNKIIYHKWYQSKYKELGRTFGKYEGVTPTICSIDPEFIKEVTVKQFDNFTDVIPHEFAPEQTTLDRAKGDRWRMLRKMMSPTFTSGKLKQMMMPIDKIADDVIDQIGEKIKENPVVDFKPIIGGFTLDTVGRVAFGLQTNCHRGEDKEFSETAMGVFQALEIKSWGMVMFFQVFAQFPEIIEKIGLWPPAAGKLRTLTHDLIEERNKKNTPDSGDFVDRLREFKKAANPQIPDLMIDAQGMVFLTAGYETTANTIGSMIHIAATMPEIQEKIVQEINDEIGSDEITHDSISKLHYLEACIMETLRIYTPVTEHDRTCTKDTVVNGIKVLKGTLLKFAIYAAHHDPEFFPEPEQFKPERFFKENADDLIPFTFRPFGSGNRVCIGQRFAILEIKIFMAKLLAKYKISATPQTSHICGPGVFAMTIYPQVIAKAEVRN